jgi:hypothetical protein
MAMATAIWAAAAEATITGGAEGAVITTAGHAGIIVTITVTDAPAGGVAMPALIGYMLAIVITLGSYFAALNWLIQPPDPWQSSAKITTGAAQHVAARKRPPVVKPAEATELQPMVPAEPGTRSVHVETSTPSAAN